MITALLLGIFFGFVLSIPPGPLAVTVIKKSFEGRFRPAFMTAFGAAVMDVFYTLAATFTSSALVIALGALFVRYKWLSLLFQILCIVVLVVLGLRYLRQRYKVPPPVTQSSSGEPGLNKSAASPFWVGVLIAFTNLASPTFLPTMIASVSYLHGEGLLEQGFNESISYSCGFGVGTALWFFALIRFLLKQRTKISPNFITSIYKFAGWTFILFALILAYKIIVHTSWSKLF